MATEVAMQLIQARVRCVQGIEDSGWFVPGRGATVVHGRSQGQAASLLRALQALNPPCDIEVLQPFSDHPQRWRQAGHSRLVIPAKKTAVFMVFAATPDQPPRLAELDDDLIETDRIELGRRLDLSRWTSFVELSAASRWRDVRADMKHLLAVVGQAGHGGEQLLGRLQGPERLAGSIGDECLEVLAAIAPQLPVAERQRYRRCLSLVQRHTRFQQAEELVAGWIPLTIMLRPEQRLPQRLPLAALQRGVGRDNHLPITNLLALLAADLDDGTELAEGLAKGKKRMEELAQLLYEQGWPVPEITVAAGEVLFSRAEAATPVVQRLRLLAAVCLIAACSHPTRPILLLDGFDRDLTGEAQAEMVRRQQQLGRWYQLIAATDDERVALAAGWQKMYRLGQDGVATAG